jgi:hypothetical protein
MAQAQFFEIRRRPVGHRNISVIVDTEQKRGHAIMRSLTAPQKGVPCDEPADGVGSFLGFLTRDVVDGGPTVIQRAQLWGDQALVKELEQPFSMGQECSLELADAYIVEGDERILTSGTGAITNSTAIGTRCSFVDGKTYVAQSGDDVLYQIADNSGQSGTQLTADGDGPRLRLERITTP